MIRHVLFMCWCLLRCEECGRRLREASALRGDHFKTGSQ